MLDSGIHHFNGMDRVVHGQPAPEALAREVERLGKKKVFLITNRSLSESASVQRLIDALGDRLAGRFAAVTAHAPREAVLAGAEAVRGAEADILVAVGGGSVIDATKIMQLCLRHGISRMEQLSDFSGKGRADPSTRPDEADRWIRAIAIPTTLSAAEFSWWGGTKDRARGVAQSFSHAMMIPQVVIMDPCMTLETPKHLLLTTGMKAVDHAVERLASLKRNPFNEAVSSLALRLLVRALRGAQRDPADLDARAELQYGAFMSMLGGSVGVTVGVGHAIGHALGAHLAVPHGETSCVVMPAVMRWNRSANSDRQSVIATALGGGEDASVALGDLVAELGLPRTLRDLGVARSDLPELARKAYRDPLTQANPRPVQAVSDVEEILDLAW